MLPVGQAGVLSRNDAGRFAPQTEPSVGNNLPGWTGSPGNSPDVPGPHPYNQPLGGNVGHYDTSIGTDPQAPKVGPYPPSTWRGAWSEGDPGSTGPPKEPMGYGGDAPRPTDGAPSRLGPNLGGDPLPNTRPSWWRNGIIGYNDQLQVRDRHGFWSRGKQRFHGPGVETGGGRNPQLDGPPSPAFQLVQISVNPQIGSDNTRNQDDLSRPYTWIGQADGSVQPVYGGVPGLWQHYGSRGGYPLPVEDPTNGEGGPELVYSGPPHGLHSETLPDGKQLADRYKATPQNRPVRFDRPSNSRISGQSYSQTVQTQGGVARQQQQAPRGLNFGFNLRGGVG